MYVFCKARLLLFCPSAAPQETYFFPVTHNAIQSLGTALEKWRLEKVINLLLYWFLFVSQI
jgi:hypothetical protein